MAIIGEIRKHSGLAVIIVGIAILAFIIGDLFKGNAKQPALGVIDGEEITYGRYYGLITERENLIKQQMQSNQITNEQSHQIREDVWRELVETKLTEKEYGQLGLQVSQREMNDMYLGDFIHPYLMQMPAFIDPSTGAYNKQMMAQLINNFDQLDTATQAELVQLEKYVKQSREQEKYNVLVASGFYFPTKMAEKMVEIENNNAATRVVSLPFQSVADDQITLTEQDYKAYYEKHKNEYKQQTDARDLDFIIFPVNPTNADLANIQNGVFKVWEEFQTIENSEIPMFVNSESEADARYDSTFVKSSSFAAPFDSLIANATEGQFIAPRIVGRQWMMSKVQKIENRPDSLRASVIVVLNSNFNQQIARTAEQSKALTDSLERELKAGRLDFNQAVMTFSDDPSKTENQGDMGWALDGGYGMLNEQIVAANLNDVFVFERPDNGGYHIVKVTGKTPATKKYRVATIVRDIVPSDETANAVYAQANKFASEALSHNAMLEAAKAQNLMVRSADFTTANANRIPGVENARAIIQWAFNEETKVGDVASQVFESDDMYVVVALKEIRQKGYASLDQVRNYIEGQVRNEKKAEVLMAKAEEAVATTKDIVALSAKLQASIDSVSDVNFNSYSFGKFGPEMNAIGSVAATKEAKLLAPVKGYYGVYLIQVDNVQQVSPADVNVKKQGMEMEAQQKLRYLMDVLKENTEIEDNRVLYF
ncbi:MAG: SurA N-terminal domain-containing protein [Bacteroidales bacterium]|nr:SurA N-terminal domain-containing protein [Bacteroidales bacterium]